MNCFGGMVDQRKALGLISKRDFSQRFSPSHTSDTPRAGLESVLKLSPGFVNSFFPNSPFLYPQDVEKGSIGKKWVK